MKIMEESVDQLDEIIQIYKTLINCDCEEGFARYLSNQERLIGKCIAMEEEYRELKDRFNSALKDISVLQNKLRFARRWYDEEKLKRKQVTRESGKYCQQLNAVRKILLKDCYSKLPECAKKKLMFLENVTDSSSDYVDANCSSHPEHFNFTGQFNSSSQTSSLELSVARSNSDLDDIAIPLKKSKPTFTYSSFMKKFEGIDTKVEVGISNEPNFKEKDFQSITDDKCYSTKLTKIEQTNNNIMRHHNFINKNFIMPQTCSGCHRKIAFGRRVLKCAECKIVVHSECRDDILPVCKSYSTLMMEKTGCLSEYLENASLFVPTVVVDCVNEIEHRGLHENGLYQKIGSKLSVKCLVKEMHCKKRLNLLIYDVHSICHGLMVFLKNLEQPLITYASWKNFIQATRSSAEVSDLDSHISKLPRVNRDTLAFIVLHLQNLVSKSNTSIDDLAFAFGQVIFGRNDQLHDGEMFVKEMILLPREYWRRFVDFSQTISMAFTSTPLKGNCAQKLCFSPMTPDRKRFFNISPPI